MQNRYQQVKEIKEQTDFLLIQLSEGDYLSLDTYANNVAHLAMAFEKLRLYIDDVLFLAWLREKDAVLVSEIAVTGRTLMVLQNFFRLAQQQ
ncbi:hypothetical protein [Pantoea vagans]|uniref:hypothetical protein n=1 Tax=Pantoea vagans TaxID=470934 RepID=UPI0023B202CB|nr:hypothetical protein [Pantoea vagans]MDE8559353.1 hypothetical protein [Pantoea vagans]MDE8579353.1 hypothetical protein [Pantoea vagans]